MVDGGSLPCSQEPATGPYPESQTKHFSLPRSFQRIRPIPRSRVKFREMLIFYDEALLAHCPATKLEGHPLSATRNCLFNIFAATLHIWGPSPSSAALGRAMPWW
jgi:hypothetical protein